jgi:hypothetical protein
MRESGTTRPGEADPDARARIVQPSPACRRGSIPVNEGIPNSSIIIGWR